MLSEEQKRLLEAKLDPDRVQPLKDHNGRPVLRDGKPVEYIEAWDVIEQANRIFGFGNWSRETVIVRAIHEPVERPHEDVRKVVMVAAFWAKVRITVHAPDAARSIVREGCGAATSHQKTIGDAVEMAIKAAESDATKRAFATMGNQFGLALYDKQRRNVGHDAPQIAQGSERPMSRLDESFGDVGAAPDRQSDHPPQPSTSQRALARLEPPRPNGNGGPRPRGLRY